MGLWIAMAALAAAACLPVLVALTRSRAAGRAEPADLAIYRDQLDEVGRDVGRGIIAEAEAAAARAEIARRLIRASDEAPAAAASPAGSRRAAVVAVLAMPVAALAVYLAVGSPHLADQPLSARLSLALEDQDISTLVARVEAHLAANPEDGAGWEVLAPVYLRLGRSQDAMSAYANALRLLGSTAERQAGLGAAIVGANDGVVSDEARDAFERARALAPNDMRPQFYLALGLGQEGRIAEAIAAWRALLAAAPPDAPWAAAAIAELARLEAADAGPPAPGPSPADIESAGKLAPQERLVMIEGMVASLAARLEADPGDADGWARLIRSYMVLDRPGDAGDALDRARTALAGEPEKLALIDETARSLGLAQ